MDIKLEITRTARSVRDRVRESLGQVRPLQRISCFGLIGLRRGMETSEAALGAVEEACRARDGVSGAWFVPELDRLVVKIAIEADFESVFIGLLADIARLEQAQGYGRARFHTRSRCPDFRAHRLRLYLEMGLDLAGFGSGLLMRKVNERTFRFFADASALALFVEYTPEIRQPLDEWLGRENSALLLRYLETISESFSQGWSGSLVDLVRRGMQWQAETARELCWFRIAEQALQQVERSGQRQNTLVRPFDVEKGPVERYHEAAEKYSLAAFSAGMAFTHDLTRSAATQFSAIPRPALLGQDAFCHTITRELASAGVLVLDAERLTLLDRVDRIIVDQRYASASRLVITTRYPASRAALDLQKLNDLLDEESLSPDWEVSTVRKADELPARMRRWWESTGQPLESLRLFKSSGRVRDAALVEWATDRTIESLQSKARSAEIRLTIIDARDEAVIERVQRYQRQGETILALGPRSLLDPADIAVGILGEGETWAHGADMLTRHPLDTLWRLISASEKARLMAKQSVDLAKIDAFSGLILSLEPLERRILSRMRLAANLTSLAALVNGYRLARAIQGMPAEFVDDATPWHAMDIDTVREQLEWMQGASEVLDSMQPMGPRSLTQLWLEEMKSPLVPVLMTGTGLAALTGALGDAFLIATVMGVNGLVGGLQRRKTERQLNALGMAKDDSIEVTRRGDILSVASGTLAPGDEICLRAGDLVPADARISYAELLEMDESSLTGESLPVKKSVKPTYSANLADRHSMLYEGTAVVQGQCRAIVVKEKVRSEARRGHLVSADVDSGVEARLDRLTNITVPVAAFSGVALLLSGLSRQRPVKEVVSSGVSLAVAAVPEGLPILATLSQLAAAGRLSDQGALARNPRAIEALGRMTVLCADKTGTLTEGRLALRYVTLDGHAQPVEKLTEATQDVLAVAWLATPQSDGDGSDLVHVTDQAVAEAVNVHAPAMAKQAASWRRAKELPFKSERGYYAALFQKGGKKRVCVKGAPEVLIERCNRIQKPDGKVVPLDDRAKDALIRHSHELAAQGLRVLAIAERPARSLTLNREKVARLIFRGFVGLADPVRDTAKKALEDLSKAGVRVKMITGDHPVTAQAIARELGINEDQRVLTGSELESLSDDELVGVVTRASVFARVTPAQKARIVKALQANGETVGMTGDGANDAAAIRLADVGIALGRDSSPSAQQGADLLVADGRIETIGVSVLEGRALWKAVRDAVSLLVGGNLGEIGFTLLAGLFEGRSPLNARQLLLVNLLTDTLPALAVALRKPTGLQADQLMMEGPEASLGEALTREIQWRAGLTGGVTAVVWTIDRWLEGPERASTVAMLTLIGSQLSQTLLAGKGSRDVLVSSFGALAVLVLMVEMPGLSRMFGCTRPGVLGWALVSVSLGASLAGSRYLPWISNQGERAADRLAMRLNHWLTDDALESEMRPYLAALGSGEPGAQGRDRLSLLLERVFPPIKRILNDREQ